MLNTLTINAVNRGMLTAMFAALNMILVGAIEMDRLILPNA
jgi:hypothetical protein